MTFFTFLNFKHTLKMSFLFPICLPRCFILSEKYIVSFNQDLKHFHHPRKFRTPLQLIPSPNSQLLVTADLISVPTVLSFPNCPMIEACIMQPFLSGFFHLAQCFYDISMLLLVLVVYSFYQQNSIPLYGWTTIC